MTTRILIVEDNFIASDEVKDRLHDLGYTNIETAFSGSEAVEKAVAFQPHLILMDINLGRGIDGIEAATKIQAEQHVAMIYLTAYDDEKTLQRAKITEPHAYIIKPFEEQELIVAIEIALYKRKIESALRESEEKYRLLAENTSDGVTLVEDNQLKYISPGYLKLIGYSQSELISLPLEQMFSFIHPGDVERIKAAIQEAHKAQKAEYGYEFRFRTKSGAYIWIEDKVNSQYDEQGRRIRSIVHSRDITDRKQIEAEREWLIVELKQALNQVKTLKGLLPICANCKKIRDDQGYWQQVEVYIYEHAQVEFSHGICPDCMKELYPEFYKGDG